MSNVLINGRSAVHKDSGGLLTTIDVCFTKIGKHTVPIPYMNVAQSCDADKTASSVTINGQPVCTKDSVFSKSKGDEPGNKKGVISGTKGDKASFIMGSTNVKIEGCSAVRALDFMVSNNKNTPPMPLMQNLGVPPLPLPVQAAEALDPSEEPEQIAPFLRVQQPYFISELPVLTLPDGRLQYPYLYDGDAWCFTDPEYDTAVIVQTPVLYACPQGVHLESFTFDEHNRRPGPKWFTLVTQGVWPDQTELQLHIQQWDGDDFVDRDKRSILISGKKRSEMSMWYAPITLNPFDIYRVRIEHPLGPEIFSIDTLFIEQY